MAPEDKSYASPAGDMAKLLAAIEKLQSEVADIKKKVDGKKEPKKEYDSELALAAALAPLCGLSTWGLGSSVLAVRFAARRCPRAGASSCLGPRRHDHQGIGQSG
jgi:hypothetical protein